MRDKWEVFPCRRSSQLSIDIRFSSPRSVVAPRVAGTVDRHAGLLSTKRRVGGSKFSSLSRDTRYPAKDCSSELQACFGVDVRSDGGERPPRPFTCVVVSVSLLNIKADVTVHAVCGVEVVAMLSGGSSTLKPAASAFPSIV